MLRLSLSSRGYTLVELLVVSAVIAVMAGALLPVLGSARVASMGASDLENMGNLSFGALIYSEDADKLFVCAGAPALDMSWSPARDPKVDAAGRPWKGWGMRLAPYARSYDAFRSAFFPQSARFAGDCAHANGMRMTNNYALNWMLASDGTYGDGTNRFDRYAWSPDGARRFKTPFNMEEVPLPGNTVALTVSSAISPMGSELGCLGVTVQASDFTNELGRSGGRGDGANLGFADGHANYFGDERLVGSARSASRARIYHLPERKIWMEPTMPNSSLGF